LRIEFDFGQGAASDADESPDFSGQDSLGSCPKCGARVFEHGVAYVCERAVGPARSCDFRSGKIILQQAIEREQMQKLLSTGRTDLITRFISKRGRPFKAFLVKTPGGRIGFEFMARPERKPGGAKAAAPAEPASPAAKAPAPGAAARGRAKTAAKAPPRIAPGAPAASARTAAAKRRKKYH
jgi:DNA topoisomerase-3